MTAALLERAGFQVLQAGDASEASDIWASESKLIDLVMADVCVSGLSAPEAGARVLADANGLEGDSDEWERIPSDARNGIADQACPNGPQAIHHAEYHGVFWRE